MCMIIYYYKESSHTTQTSNQRQRGRDACRTTTRDSGVGVHAEPQQETAGSGSAPNIGNFKKKNHHSYNNNNNANIISV